MNALTMTSIFEETKIKNNDTLSSRLVYALNRLRINQSELARKVGIKPQVIQYLCTSNANTSKFAYEIAIALEINPNWLIAGKGPIVDATNIHNPPSTQPKVPLLPWNNIVNWLSNENKKSTQLDTKFIYINIEMPTNSYALRITDTSMVPRFEIGTTLIIDPNNEPKNGDFVIAKTLYQEQPIARQFINKQDSNYLMPINTAMYKEIKLSMEDKILGIVRQTYYEFTR